MLPSLFSPYTRRHPARKRLTGANHSPHRLHIEQLENRTLLSGTPWVEEAKLTASDAAAGDWFGYATAISGDTLVVGSSGDNDGAGSVYVFQRTGTTWTEQVKLSASDAAAGDFFGWPVSISGNTIVVGAGGNDDAGSTSGSGFIFTLVVNPIAAINDLTNIVFEMELSQGMKNALQSKLDLPLRALTDDNLQNDVSAINSLQAFINAVEAQREKKISEADADNLTAAALATIGLLEEEMEI